MLLLLLLGRCSLLLLLGRCSLLLLLLLLPLRLMRTVQRAGMGGKS